MRYLPEFPASLIQFSAESLRNCFHYAASILIGRYMQSTYYTVVLSTPMLNNNVGTTPTPDCLVRRLITVTVSLRAKAIVESCIRDEMTARQTDRIHERMTTLVRSRIMIIDSLRTIEPWNCTWCTLWNAHTRQFRFRLLNIIKNLIITFYLKRDFIFYQRRIFLFFYFIVSF